MLFARRDQAEPQAHHMLRGGFCIDVICVIIIILMKLSILDRAPRKQVCVRFTALCMFFAFFVDLKAAHRERAHRGGAVNDLNLLYDLY